jgi:uridine kinase
MHGPSRVPVNGTVVVGVAGGSGSGKTTVVREVARRIGPPGAAVLRHDAYYHDLSHLPPERRAEVNVDHPDSLQTELLVDHIAALVDGRPVDVPIYDFASQTRSPERVVVRPAPVVIVEGILVLADARLRRLLDLGVFVQVDEHDRLARRLARDVSERGRSRESVRKRHEEVVQPMHARFVEPSRRWADFTIPDGGHNSAAIDLLVQRIHELRVGG